jgi:uncharacterized protein YqgC (DUF456 family)
MDIIIITIAILLSILGLAGCFFPALPGPPLSYGALLLLHFTGRADFSGTQLILWLFLIILLQVLDYLTPILGSKYSGGTQWGNRGCIAGSILGIFFMPWGIIAGPFLGAVVGELLGGSGIQQSIRAGLGALLGFIVGTLLKVIVCFYLLYQLIAVLI